MLSLAGAVSALASFALLLADIEEPARILTPAWFAVLLPLFPGAGMWELHQSRKARKSGVERPKEGALLTSGPVWLRALFAMSLATFGYVVLFGEVTQANLSDGLKSAELAVSASIAACFFCTVLHLLVNLHLAEESPAA